MALIDVSEVLTDPDFMEPVTRVRRAMTVDEYGDGTLTEVSDTISACVQPGQADALERGMDMSTPKDWRVLWTIQELVEELPAVEGYADVIIWQGKRYQVKACEHFNNWGAGYYKALCLLDGSTGASTTSIVTAVGEFVTTQGT